MCWQWLALHQQLDDPALPKIAYRRGAAGIAAEYDLSAALAFIVAHRAEIETHMEVEERLEREERG